MDRSPGRWTYIAPAFWKFYDQFTPKDVKLKNIKIASRLGVVGRPGSTSWCTPMRFYKVFGVKTGPMGLKAKKYYFSNGISMNFVFPGHTELLPGHTELLPGRTT